MTVMRQCRLERGPSYRRDVTVAWIEDKFARVGRVVDLDGDDWIVARVGSKHPAGVRTDFAANLDVCTVA